jgi:cytochrome c556
MKRSTPVMLLSASLGLLVIAAGLRASESLRPAPPELTLRGQDVEAIVDHRRGVMRATSGHIRATTAILIDGVGFEDSLPMHAGAIAALLADIPALFPEGSVHANSEARPEIWQSWDTFGERAQTSADRARAFEEAVRGGNRQAMVQAFRAIGETCGACHDDYRVRN